MGNITQIADLTDASYSRTFGYDDVNRLITANTGASLWGNGSYTWDAMGNALSATLGSRTRSFSYSGTTPLINVATDNGVATAMSYDGDGNELNGPGAQDSFVTDTRSYSPRNLLKQAVLSTRYCFGPMQGETCTMWGQNFTTYDNGYDAQGVRVMVRKSQSAVPAPVDAVYYFYTPELTPLNMVLPAEGAQVDVISFAGRPLADEYIDSGERRFIFTDHLGTPILQTSTTGGVVWRAEYEPFGNVYTMRTGSRADQTLRFPGQQVSFINGASDEESYNIFRWYRAGWGRYTQVDPLEWAGQEYAYASENPIGNTDVLGLFDTGSAAKDLLRHAINTCEERTESAWGGPLLGALWLLARSGGDLNPEEFENQIKKCNKCKKNCKPCIPPVGTIAYREDTNPKSPPHKGVPPPHWHLYRMNQNPYNCRCFWRPVPDNRGGFGASPPPSGTVPITPAAGGGEW